MNMLRSMVLLGQTDGPVMVIGVDQETVYRFQRPGGHEKESQ